MRTQQLTKQLIAFMAACVVVFTLWYIWVLWRNQSPERVLSLAAGQPLYETSDFVIGTTSRTPSHENVTLLHFTADGGWVIAGRGQWINEAVSSTWSTLVTIIPNHTTIAADAEWLCAVQRDKHVTGIQLYNAADPNKSETYEFHHGGIVEPVSIAGISQLRGLSDGHTVFSVDLDMPRN